MLSSTDIAQFIVEGSVSEVARDAAAEAILDTLSVMFAGASDPGVVRLAGTMPAAEGMDAFPAFLVDTSLRSDDAALLYGMAAHALDFDDVCMLAICHPSAPVLAALLACAPWSEIAGPALCDAHAIGTEVMIRIGQAVGFRHYEIGFHATATMGVFGAVAAVARLRELDYETTVTALAIAASLASGLRLNFGTAVKPLHAGLAASNALRSVSWAKAGLSASSANLFGANGILGTLSGRDLVTWPHGLVLGLPFAIVNPGFEQKRFACCYMLHKVIALGIDLADAGLRLSDIESLHVEMPRGGTRPLIYPEPKTGKEALFSLPYALLAAIADGTVTTESFTDAAVSRRELRERLCDVTVEEVGDDGLTAEQVGAAEVRLAVRFRTGESRNFARTAAPGSPDDPLSRQELRLKWSDCLAQAGATDAEASSELYDDGLETMKHGILGPWLSRTWNRALRSTHSRNGA